MIKMQWLPLILNGKSTDKALFGLYEDIHFIWIWACFKFKKIYIYLHYITFSHLAYAFTQSDLLNEDNRSNQNQQKSNNMQVLFSILL